MPDYKKQAIALHKKLKGKIKIVSKIPLADKETLSKVYTPGVGAVCTAIREDRKKVWEYTNRGNMVAIVSDGTAILGLGNIGPEAGIPVMEGKSAIFSEFAGVDAVPICINTTDVEEIIQFCKMIEPSFGGINLEDISAPRCFEITERLEKELDIAVFHDDQDGTAIVILAAMINSCRAEGREIKDLKVVINGSGAAGIATARLLLAQGLKNIILIDSIGTIYKGRTYMNKYKEEIAEKTNKKMVKGRLEDSLSGADVFIGLSKANLMDASMVRSMSPKPFIFALANPIPEIMPDEAKKAGAAIVGTGRSDFPNQVNNALVFPGIFRGLLDGRHKKVSTKMKLLAALAIANSVKKPSKDNILPKIRDKNVVKAISKVILTNKS
jgi:malate dehydrogenase (oxaloacetate-decarboxylating)